MTWNDIKYFKPAEFDCKCGCGKNNISLDLVQLLDHVRYTVRFPMEITSGCRCDAYNLQVGGVADSAHVLGLAADISADTSFKRFALLNALISFFPRVGVGATFIHVDIDATKPQLVAWVYA